jgi:diacylglycerol kinase (ATP)
MTGELGRKRMPGASGGWLGRRLQSFRHASRGLGYLLAEPNARIHALVAVLVLALSASVGLSTGEWALIALAVALVLVAEALNTALERLADAAVPTEHPLVGAAKDLAAAGVLLAPVGAAVIGVLVLGPRLWALVTR